MYSPYLALPFFWMHFAADNLREKMPFDGGRVLVVELAGQKSTAWSGATALVQEWLTDIEVSHQHEQHRDHDTQRRLSKHLQAGAGDDTFRGLQYVRVASAPNSAGNFLVTAVFETRQHAQHVRETLAGAARPARFVRVRVALDAGMYVGIDARADYNVKFTRSTIAHSQKMGMFTIFTLSSAMLGDLSHSNAFNTMTWAEYPGESTPPAQGAVRAYSMRAAV